jgi:hypothetical protein
VAFCDGDAGFGDVVRYVYMAPRRVAGFVGFYQIFQAGDNSAFRRDEIDRRVFPEISFALFAALIGAVGSLRCR